ncbi:MAG: radical SAM protein [Pyrinomonadaceae bacterium]|nr:radical SAM protein [Pyrinomonadaceae bacterium]
MQKSDVIRAWGRILSGRYPNLSIEITRECPLRCPGCYAYEPAHLGTAGPLRSLADYKGDELVEGVMGLVRKHRPLHLSIVGGEPLVRFRELNALLPRLGEMGIDVQLVTSAVREIPREWAKIKGLYVVVSIDGLQPDHDKRRKPATYERILKHIAGHAITVHCTITRQMTKQPDYFKDFLDFWTANDNVRQVWFSLFTPQLGATDEEILAPQERFEVLNELSNLRSNYPKLMLPDAVLAGYRKPPASPDECIFSRTTLSMTADLQNLVTPCQFGGTPDCSQCGCIASAGLNAVGDHRLFNILPVRKIFNFSDAVGKANARIFGNSI